MIERKKLTPLVLAGIFIFMLGLSYAAVPLYDLFCRVTGFGGTTQVSNNAPKRTNKHMKSTDTPIGIPKIAS